MSSTVPPFLPPEIIDEILRSEELDQCDLANCCLVNSGWVDSARKSLYNTLTVGLVPGPELSDAEGEAVPDDTATVVHSYYLDPPSSLLFSTLLSTRRLRPLVRAISYSGELRRNGLSDDNVIWMQPPDVVTTFARLCPLATALSLQGCFRFSGNCREALRLHCKSLTHLELASALQEDWEELRHFKNLISLKTSWTGLPEPPFRLPPLGLSLVSFCVSDFFRPNDFKAIPSSTWRFLRHLQVPIMMVSEIRSLHFPHLHRLVLTIGDHIPESMTSAVTRSFLGSLRSFDALRIFEIDAETLAVLDPDCDLLRKSLPIGCQRVTFWDTPPFDALLNVIEPTGDGHRIRGLGLNEWMRDETEEVDREFRADASAAVEAANVEIIWVPLSSLL